MDQGREGMAEAVTRHWLIDGRVQGVGYRMWLGAEADAARVAGWVRNLSDGRVEALLRGSPEVLDRLEVAARRGPEQARVDRVMAVPWPDPVPGERFRQVADAAVPARSVVRPAVSSADDT